MTTDKENKYGGFTMPPDAWKGLEYWATKEMDCIRCGCLGVAHPLTCHGPVCIACLLKDRNP